MDNLKTYTFKQKHGIDDLYGLSAYTGSWGQGDHYSSNDPTIQHPDYVSYRFEGVPQTVEAIEAEIRRRKLKNLDYIAKLKAEGRYGEEYEVKMSFVPHPLFDDIPVVSESLMTSRMFFFDLKNDGSNADGNNNP